MQQTGQQFIPNIDTRSKPAPTLHLSDPRGFKNLSRLNLLPHYDYARVLSDLLKCQEIEIAVCLGYGLKYALDFGLMRPPAIEIEKI